MRKRDELADPQSCLNKARDDDWIFVLIQHDEDAPAAVRFWAHRRVARGKRAKDHPQIVEALAWADRVEAEQRRGQSAIEGARVGEPEMDIDHI
jgi:hypothetical protein